MSDGDAPYLLYSLMALVLVGSGLLARRVPMGQAAKMALAWVGIFAFIFSLFAFRSEFKYVGNRLYAAAVGDPVDTGSELRVDMAEDGHFWVRGEVNGEGVHFLVDSGASVTTLSASTARAAGVKPNGRRGIVSTANGDIVSDQGDVDRLEIGSIERRDFAVDISSRDDVNILGMNFLSSLSEWRVQDGELILRP